MVKKLIFKDLRVKYEQKMFGSHKLKVVPVEGQIPGHFKDGKIKGIDDWQNADIPEDVDAHGIGLLCGDKSGIIGLDIDDNEIMPQMLQHFQSQFGKFGSKGITLFFKYNGEVNKTWVGQVEILSTSRQTVLPPSPHPKTGGCYVWRGESLIDGDLSLLKPLPEDYISIIDSICSKKEYKKGEGKRHNMFKAQATAAIHAAKDTEEIAQELWDYDQKNHPIPYFTDRTEARHKKGSGIDNARKFVISMRESIADAPEVSTAKIEIVDRPLLPPRSYKEKKLPHLRGIAQEMFKYIYDNSPVPRAQFAFASSISIMSLFMGNKFKFRGTYPNLYAMILAPSGSGKDFPLRFPRNLLAKAGLANFVGSSIPASDNAVIMNLSSQPIRLDVFDEASYLFGGMTAKNMAMHRTNIANIYQELYTTVGSYYGGKAALSYSGKKESDGSIGKCNNPYIAILCAMTIEDFGETFTTQLMEKGLGGRFLFFADDEKKPVNYEGFGNPPNSIPEHIIRFAKEAMGTSPKDITREAIEATADPRTISRIVQQMETYDKIKLSLDDHNKSLPVYNRLAQTFLKLIMIDAYSIEGNHYDLKITSDSVDWATKFIDAYLHNMEIFFDENLNQDENERRRVVFERYIKQAGSKGLTFASMGKNRKLLKHGPKAQIRHEILNMLIEEQVIYKQGSGKDAVFVHSFYKKQP